MEWIETKIKLPETADKVIICLFDSINPGGYPPDYCVACAMAFFENGQWYSDNMESIEKLEDVSHWMSLPLPPMP